MNGKDGTFFFCISPTFKPYENLNQERELERYMNNIHSDEVWV